MISRLQICECFQRFLESDYLFGSLTVFYHAFMKKVVVAIIVNEHDTIQFCHSLYARLAIVKLKVAPFPGVDSIHISPWCSSTIFFQFASPMPCPSYASSVCSR